MTELETNNESVEYASDELELEEERDEELEPVSTGSVDEPEDVEVHHTEPVADPDEPRTMEAVAEVEVTEAEAEVEAAETEETEEVEEAEGPATAEAKETENGKERGTVKWFSPSKGYGFISRENGEDVFVHFSAIEGGVIGGFRTLREGDRVAFEVQQTPKGPRAEHVELV